MYKLYCRIYQMIFRLVTYVLPWRVPALIEGKNSLSQLPKLIRDKGIDTVLIITDSGVASLGLMDGLLAGLDEVGTRFVVYDKTVPNPTIDNIEEALQLYYKNGCKGLVAFGGGSAMDCAKAVGARIARPKKSIPQLRGLMKVRRRIPLLFAVPTTAGTGSETTLAAVIKNSETHEKYSINSFALIPRYAVLDPMLTVGLPPHITATTGMDALVHAIEAFIGHSNTRKTREYSKKAIELIFTNLPVAYRKGEDIGARTNMLKAAFYAGAAFTRAYVGYVHAVGHTLSGFYGLPHGLVNAVIVPYMLEYYGKSVYKPLTKMADIAQIGDPEKDDEQQANQFINAIREMNKDMGIPDKISGIKEKDIPEMVRRALKEANPLYPVPKILNKEDLTKIFYMIMK